MSSQSETSKAITAAVIGNALEWYDFAVYSYVATIIARNFFPSGDDAAALLATFAVFGAGFIIRPLGGIVIGWMGDAMGRKAAMVVTILLMAFGTALIGVIPSYATIGIWAPILLVLARLLQSFSVGGEFGSAIAFIVEWAPPQKRGLYGSLQQISVVAGLLLGSAFAALLTTIMTPEALEAWGWRIPFLVGGVIGLVGLYMRRNVGETPAYRRAVEAASQSEEKATPPMLLALRAFGFATVWTVSFYIFLFYMPTFTQKFAGISRSAALWSNTAGLVLLMLAIPVMGALSDRIGRKPLLLACCVAFIILPYPLFHWMLSGVSLTTIVLIQLLVGLAISLFAGPAPAAMAEIFATRTRSTYMSTGYAFATTIFGGFAPFIATWLIGKTGSPISPTYYVIAAAVISLVAVLGLRETAHKPLG
jgi:MHS family proline/betaine transporter-like MFS transporter